MRLAQYEQQVLSTERNAGLVMDNEPIKIVQTYTYLGTLISSTCNFSLALDNLKEKALHALFSLRKHSKLPPFLANKIFDAIISPNYNI